MRTTNNWLLLLAIIIFAGSLSANTGVALIHGKGSDKSSDQQGAIDYWTTAMIRDVTDNYQYPHVVVHYNGKAYMWDAAKQVGQQLYDFIRQNNIDNLVINTHSFGGTVIRWIFSNPEQDSRYPLIIQKTSRVNIIACPCKGSEAADLAGELSGSWLTGWLVELVGQSTNATVNCSTSKMNEYNATVLYGTPGRPSLPKPFYWISGYGLWNKWETEDIGLATLSGIVGMPGEDDGMVCEYSAQAVGNKFFRTKANHHHNRRNDFDQEIGKRLAESLQNRQPSPRWPGELTIQLPPALRQDAAEAHRFHGAMNSKIPAIEPYQVRSTRYVEIVKLNQRQASLPIYLEQSECAYLAIWPLTMTTNYQVSFDSRNNNGVQAVCLQEKAGLPDERVKGLQINHPVLGEYALAIETRDRSDEYALVVNTYSDLAMECSLSSEQVFTRDRMTFSAKLADGQQAITGARVVAYLSRHGSDQKEQIALNDNGDDGDATANDGIYSCCRQIGVATAAEPGSWFVQFSADGTTGEQRHHFRRTAGLYFQHAVLGGSILTPVGEYQWSGDDNQRYLAVKVPVRIYQPGQYKLSGIITKGEQAIAWSKETRQFKQGKSYCFLLFSEQDIKKSGLTGPFRLQMQLVSLDRIELSGRRYDYCVESDSGN